MQMMEIRDGIVIRENQLVYKVSRSSGPGGQNVNKVNTRVMLLFDVANCGSFSEMQKQQILSRLSGRADKNGVIRIISQKFRTQQANRQAVRERLQQLLIEALETPPVRKKTGIPLTAKERRLEKKRRRGLLKQQRANRDWPGD
jgi:ribosome-associated protein